MQTQSSIYIGTSGIVLPGNKDTFPAEFKSGTRLHYYSSLFNSLEINSSFYKTPKSITFAKWAAEVNDDFRFTVKMPGAITHSKNLDFDPEELRHFMHSIDQLGSKKGALLIQFPAKIKLVYFLKVEEILKQVKSLCKNSEWALAIELRDSSWYDTTVYQMLKKYEASLVFHDMPASKTPLEQPATNIAYLRLHGPTGDYKGSYSIYDLEQYAALIRRWHNNGDDVFVYFNNTIGNAYSNAMDLKKMVCNWK
ncbi:MAG: hypothetical protein B0W54_04885 [Cellvibrio sp. 79]|nr:MAG: hypothetical protein B0W54_04885 [Cellvibrio sp. 79]